MPERSRLNADRGNHMKFIHFTDPHLMPAGVPHYGMDTRARFDACLDDIARHHRDAAFCVITGDLTENGDTETYRWLKERLTGFPLKTHLLLGNCDNRQNFLSVFGGPSADSFVQSAIRQDGHLLLFLDTLGEGQSAEGRFDVRRRDWIRRQLADRGKDTVLVFMHHPPFDIGHRNDAIKLADGDEFLELAAALPARHIFFGHTHRPVSGVWRGVGFTGLPGLSFQIPLVTGSVGTDASREPPLYGVVAVNPSGVVVNMDAFLDRAPLGNFSAS